MTAKHYRFLIFLLILSCVMMAACTKQESLKPSVLNFWVVGGEEGKTKRFGADFSQTMRALRKDKNSPYSEFFDASGDYIQGCYHTLFYIIFKKLVETELLPPIPEPVPDYFGVFINLGHVYHQLWRR